MTHKITGTVSEESRLIIIDELDFTTIEHNGTVSGTYDVTVTSGSKTVLLRSSEGETFGYGAVSPTYEGIGGIDSDTMFIAHFDTDEVPSYDVISNPQIVIGGKFADAMSFDGVNDYLRILNTLNIDFKSNDFTIDAWVKPDSNKEYQLGVVYIMGYHETGDNFFEIHTNTSVDSLRVYVYNGSYDVNLEAACLKDVWSHIAVEGYNNTMYVYVNGNMLASDTYSKNNMPPNQHSYIGRSYYYSPYNTRFYYKGLMDEFRISHIARYQGQNFTPPSMPYSVE